MANRILFSLVFLAAGGSHATAQQVGFDEGVLTAFCEPTQPPESRYSVRYSPDGTDLASGKHECVYRGASPVAAIMPYKSGAITAFVTPGGSEVRFSPDGKNLSDDELLYKGRCLVTALAPSSTGVLVALWNPDEARCRVHYSPNGKDLTAGRVVYDGADPVISLAPFRGGVLVSIEGVGDRAGRNRVVFSPALDRLGEGETVYAGACSATYLVPQQGGVFVAFAGCGVDGGETSILFSPDGKNLGGGSERFRGRSMVCGMIPYRGGLMCAFKVAGGDGLYHVRYSPDGHDIGTRQLVYNGYSPVTAMSQFSAGAYADAALVGDQLHPLVVLAVTVRVMTFSSTAHGPTHADRPALGPVVDAVREHRRVERTLEEIEKRFHNTPDNPSSNTNGKGPECKEVTARLAGVNTLGNNSPQPSSGSRATNTGRTGNPSRPSSGPSQNGPSGPDRNTGGSGSNGGQGRSSEPPERVRFERY